MRLRTAIAAGSIGLAALGVLWAQQPFKQWPAIEYENFPLPPDANRPAEWTRARLRYPDITGYPGNAMDSFSRFGRSFAGYWTMDYPRSDRHLLAGVRRLTRIDSRSVEQVVTLDGSGEVDNWPDPVRRRGRALAAAGGPGRRGCANSCCAAASSCATISTATAPYRGVREWDTFLDSMRRVFPDRPIEDIPNNDPIFHTIYDLDDRFQVPGAQFIETGLTYEAGETGKEPHWRCIRDDKGRIMVAICHNMDLGDAWEHSDNPEYPEKYASLAYRIAMNYFIYDLTH